MARKAPSQIAVTLYNVRDFAGSPKEIAKTFRRIRKIGYENVQISAAGFRDADPDELRAMMDDGGVRAVGSHLALAMLRDDLDGVVAKSEAWGCRYVCIPSLPVEARDTTARWKARAREFTRLGKALAKRGMVLQYHNHNFEFQKFGGRKGIGGTTGLALLYENADPKYVQAEIDVGWVARGGGDPAAWCLRMKGRMDQVHVKDWMILDGEPAWAEIGEGNLNWPAILDACKAAGVQTYIVEQDQCPVTGNPFRSLEISYEHLRELGLK